MKKGAAYLQSGEKRSLDLLLASSVGLILGPMAVAAGTSVKVLERQHPIFYQQRIGKGGVPFSLLKIQTMVDDADEQVVRIKDDRNDDRITRVGRVVRAANVDEVLQVWNILRGDMSFVEYRPMNMRQLESYHDADSKLFDEYMDATCPFRPGVISPATWLFHHLSRQGRHEEAKIAYMRESVVYVDSATPLTDISTVCHMPREFFTHLLHDLSREDAGTEVLLPHQRLAAETETEDVA